MLLSAEVRWFGEGGVPDEVARWFRAAPAGGAEERRDIYLLDAKQPELGIKKRGNKPGLEIKGLVARLPAIESASLRGRPALWCKWTTLALDFADADSVFVDKRRWLRKFDARAPGRLAEVLLDEHQNPKGGHVLPDSGCNVELTEVSVEGKNARWWTLGFEAFGPWSAVQSNLERTLDYVVSSAPTLSGVESLSYPEWLARYCS
jgi:hypothetical protein